MAGLVAVGGVYLLFAVQAPSEVASAPVVAAAERDPRPSDAALAGAPDDGPRGDVGAKLRVRPFQVPRPGAPGQLGAASPGGALRPSSPAEPPPDLAANLDLDTAMLEANKLYDRHNYEEARALALRLLERQRDSVRMLRVVVSSSCILGDADVAQKHWAALPELDRGQMSARCERFGITFNP
jgi:hypothetical protein